VRRHGNVSGSTEGRTPRLNTVLSRSHRSETPRWYAVAAGIIPVAIVAMAVLGSRLGRTRFNRVTAYFDYLRDVGHPGFVTVFGSAGFFVIAVVAAVLAVAGSHVARELGALVLAVVLFTTVAVDELFRLHNSFAGGDVIVRGVYWSIFSIIAFILGPWIRGRIGGWTFLVAIASLLVSEFVDFYSTVVTMSSQSKDRWTVVEETFGFLGAWYMALAGIGVASTLIRLDNRVDESERTANV
jgi:hypothetical protein